MADKWLNAEELADQLSIPTSWIYSQTRNRGPNPIPALKVGKYYRFQLAQVIEWLQGRRERGKR
jgi:excisionase family DNA binding protein